MSLNEKSVEEVLLAGKLPPTAPSEDQLTDKTWQRKINLKKFPTEAELYVEIVDNILHIKVVKKSEKEDNDMKFVSRQEWTKSIKVPKCVKLQTIRASRDADNFLHVKGSKEQTNEVPIFLRPQHHWLFTNKLLLQ